MRPHIEKTDEAEPQMRRGEVLLFLPWTLGTLLFSVNVVGAKLFLAYQYGWTRVRSEHLYLVKMPKGAPWVVSNGDLIREGHSVHFVISLVCWMALWLVTYPLV